ncbi:MAG: TonB-dependent receptor domain-containing protein, partial [Limisphaerales bacterium]
MTWVKGRHVAKFGAQIRTYYNWSGQVPYGTFGEFSFDGRFSGYPYADFLLGYPGTSHRLDPIINRSQRAYELGLYATDTFKMNRRLTLTYGLRWDYFGSPKYGDGLDYNWDPATGNVIVPQADVSNVSPLYPTNIKVVAGNPVPSPESTNFVPRISAAYLFNKDTVIRGGYGIFNEALGPFTVINGPGPFEIGETYINGLQSGQPIFSFPDPFPGIGSAVIPSQSVTGFPQNTKNGIIQQWNVSVERQIVGIGVRVSYAGSKGSNLNYYINTDMPKPSTTPWTPSRNPYPQFTSTTYQRNNGSSEYNALSVEAKRRVGELNFDWNWTWASNLDTMENLQDPYGPLPWNHDYLTPHHRVVLNTVWH